MLEQLVGCCLEQGYMECQEGRTIEVQQAQQVRLFFSPHSYVLIFVYYIEIYRDIIYRDLP